MEKGPDPLPGEPVHVEYDPKTQLLLMIGKERTFARQHDGVKPLTAWEEVSEGACFRAALEEIAAKLTNPQDIYDDYTQGCAEGYDYCARIALRALRAYPASPGRTTPSPAQPLDTDPPKPA